MRGVLARTRRKREGPRQRASLSKKPWSVEGPPAKLGRQYLIVHDANGHALGERILREVPPTITRQSAPTDGRGSLQPSGLFLSALFPLPSKKV